MLPTADTGTPRGILIRDFLIFQLKLVLDGTKDAVMFPTSIVVVALELLFGGRRRGRMFYALMRVCERFDRWLNLHGAARQAALSREGFFAGSEPGDDTLIAEIEALSQRRSGSLDRLQGSPR
jgi:hypothetical protein